MIWRFGSLVPVMMMATLSVAAAQQAVPEDCANAQTQTDMNICSYEAYKRADKNLNAAYKAAVGQATQLWGSPDRLRDAQRAWIAYRDKACAVYDYPDGGSIQPLLINECMTKVTRDRTDDLNVFAKGLGD